jgi:hypothetical protein
MAGLPLRNHSINHYLSLPGEQAKSAALAAGLKFRIPVEISLVSAH